MRTPIAPHQGELRAKPGEGVNGPSADPLPFRCAVHLPLGRRTGAVKGPSFGDLQAATVKPLSKFRAKGDADPDQDPS
jgi:hypothetical protein